MSALDELRTLDAVAFNRAIAEAAGWKFKRPGWMSKWNQKITAPDGRDQWLHGSDIIDDRDIAEVIPDYANDLNVAMELPAPGASKNVRQRDGEPNSAHIVAFSFFHAEKHASLARALATAWYAWMLDAAKGVRRDT